MEIIEELNKDITYFKNLGFDNLASKFERDLSEIQKVIKQLEEVQNAKQSVDSTK